jgi:uncharacterized repeat protein (TIGR01451 family)
LTIADTFPDQLTGITWSCSATPGSTCAASGTLSGNISTQASLNPGGTVTLVANATVKNNATGTMSNTVSVTSPIDPGANNKSATDTTDIVPQANLAVVASAPPTATVSLPITYTVSITNTGPNPATGLILTGTLGPGAVFVSSDPGGPTCQESAGKVTCNLGNLALNGSTKVVIVVTVPAVPGNFGSIFEVKSSEVDPVPGNNSSVVSVTVSS